MIRTADIPIAQIDAKERSGFVDLRSWKVKAEGAEGNPGLLDNLLAEANTLPLTLVQTGPAHYRLIQGLQKILVFRDVLKCTTVCAEIVESNAAQSDPIRRNEQSS
ncbi:MAG TPA: hypothetical protein VKQ72_22315 [Aggregatilineales bacterium]|nr:hypothetical protein [Aggregatilineales bacterium]